MKRLWLLLAAVAGCLVAAGATFALIEGLPVTTGLYWAVTTATTVGYGDVVPKSPHGRLVAVVVMLTLIPLLGAVFAKATSLHLRAHLRADLDAIRDSADKTHRIAADTYRHHTGRDHPDAPASPSQSERT